MNVTIPHLRIVVAASLLAALGYLLFSVWVFGWTADQALKGDVIGTWKSFAVGAFAFWIGSSSGGKGKEAPPPPADAKAAADDVADAAAARAGEIAGQA